MKITRRLLKELHRPKIVSADKLAAVPMCQLRMGHTPCRGLGFVLTTTGPLTRASLCECVKGCGICKGQARYVKDKVSTPCKEPNPMNIMAIINQAGVPSRYGYARLPNFQNDSGNGKEVALRLSRWCQSYRSGASRGLLIEGPVGVGKTFLLSAIVMALAARRVSVKFVDFFQLLATLKAGYSSNKADDAVLAPLIDVDVLVVDELGKGRNSDWEQSVLDQLVMGRYNQNKVILASTNYSTKRPPEHQATDHGKRLDDIHGQFKENFSEYLGHRVGERIYSRFVETCEIIELTGDDFRLKGQAAPRPSPRPANPKRPPK